MPKPPLDDLNCMPCGPQTLIEERNRADGPGGSKFAAGAEPAGGQLSYPLREVTIELQAPQAPLRRYAAPPRNISTHGIGFVIGHFVYAGTTCRVTLVSRNNERIEQTGVVTRCRYIEGSGHLHDVAVRFDAPINLDAVRCAPPLRLLVIDADPALLKTADDQLEDLNLTLSRAFSLAEAKRLVAAEQFDLIVIDPNLQNGAGLHLARDFRGYGRTAPLAALLNPQDESRRTQCLEAGFNYVVSRPLEPTGLAPLVATVRGEPLSSTRAHEAESAGKIDAFVGTLAIRMARLQRLIDRQNWVELRSEAMRMKIDGMSAGFGPIATLACQLEDALSRRPEPRMVQAVAAQLVQLCGLAQGISCRALFGDSDAPEADPARRFPDPNAASARPETTDAPSATATDEPTTGGPSFRTMSVGTLVSSVAFVAFLGLASFVIYILRSLQE